MDVLPADTSLNLVSAQPWDTVCQAQGQVVGALLHSASWASPGIAIGAPVSTRSCQGPVSKINPNREALPGPALAGVREKNSAFGRLDQCQASALGVCVI